MISVWCQGGQFEDHVAFYVEDKRSTRKLRLADEYTGSRGIKGGALTPISQWWIAAQGLELTLGSQGD